MPTEKNDRFKQIKDRLEEQMKALSAESQKLFMEIANELFEQFPEMNSFSWTQYTPYFNDGDECVFSVHTYADINGVSNDDISEGFTYGKTVYPPRHPELVPMKKAVEAFLDTAPSGMMKDIFGDHAKVTIHRDGKIEKDEYEHD